MSTPGRLARSSVKRSQSVVPNNLLRESNGSAAAAISSHLRGKRPRMVDDDDIEQEEPARSTQRTERLDELEGDEDVEETKEHLRMRAGTTLSHSYGEIERTRGRDGGSFTPGTIVRVKLQRFVTYNAVEFRPGPHLNMIIGPNGTGKSSVVCAIALGLGWKPNVLGRAKDVASFVKQGHEDGTIELELEGKNDGGDNLVIERKIFTKDNRSEWRLNGKKATAKEVQDEVDNLNIDLGNLCCFLPQDKVAEFAAMQPPELLKETQKAAGAADMSAWHESLMNEGAQQRELAGKLAKEREEVTNLEQRNEVLQRDVRRAEERQQIELAMAVLDLRIPYARYQKTKLRYDELKVIRERCKGELARLKKKLEPLSNRLIEMQETEQEMDSEIKTKQKKIVKDATTFRKLHEALESQESESQKLGDLLSSVRRKEAESKKVMQQLSRRIAETEEAVRDEPPRPDNREIDARLRAIKEELRSMRTDEAEQANVFDEISAEIKTLDRETDQTRRKLQEIDSVKAARLDMLRKGEPNTYQAVMWLRENASMFRERVFEPVLLELSIEDPSFASAVEGCINWATMKTFVCQTREDYDLFTRTLVDHQRLRLNVVEQEGGRALSAYEKPVGESELRSFGFDRYIIDCIDAPDPVLRYLCESAHLHSIPMSPDERSVDVEAVERSRKFQRYIVGPSMSTITYSHYGNRLPQALTRNLRQPRSLVKSVDQTLKRQLDRRIHEIGQRKSELEERSRELVRQEGVLKDRIVDLRKQQLELEQEKGEAQGPRSRWEKMVVNLNSQREALEHEKRKPSADEETRRLTTSLARVNSKSQEVVTQIMALMQQQVRLRGEVDESTLVQLEHQQKVNSLSVLKMEQEGQFQEAQQTLDDAVREFTTAKEEALRLHKAAQTLIDECAPDVQTAFDEAIEQSDPTLEELEKLYSEEQAKLNMMIEVRPGVMDEYNERRRRIDDLNSVIRRIAKDKEKIDLRVERLHEKWVAALEVLVKSVSERFSRAFQAIGNAGEVRISRHEDYSRWGIDIMVKFRDNEQLQLLTASRQSGGERSISTITYLLSLTEMSRSPFSLVDEINQGMDQKYERQVHDQMVNVTCRDNAGQYFLITPKLLPNLTYHDRMKVLIINNGEWIPDNGFDFGHYVRTKRRQLVGSGRMAPAAPVAV